MKDTKTKIDNARALGFLGGVVFANAVHAAIVLPAVALHLGAKGKHNLHRSHGHHGPHETTGPVQFLAEQHKQQVKDEYDLLGGIKADLDDIKKALKKDHAPKDPEPPAPEPPKPDEEPEPPKPDKEGPEPPEPDEDGPKPPKPDEKPEPPEPDKDGPEPPKPDEGPEPPKP